MKEIKAVIRPTKLPALREALRSLPGFPGMTISKAEGLSAPERIGPCKDSIRHALTDYTAKVRIEIVSPDELIDTIVERIVAAASVLAAPHRRPDFRAMEKEVTFALRENLNYAIGHQEIGRVILSLLNIFGRHGINITQDYCLMAKAVLSIEEAARALDPQFDLRLAAEPILRDLYRERYSPRVLAGQLRLGVANAITRLGDLPVDLHRLAQRISQDDLTINFQHRGLEELDDAINKASSRLTLAIRRCLPV